MIEISFDVNQVLQDRLASSMGLDRYKNIMDAVNVVDVSMDTNFQRTFNGFYLVRRNAKWRKVFYDFFEESKKKSVSFEEILVYLYEKTGNIEPSFSSKLLATLDSNKPIWDRYVIQNLQMKLEGKTKIDKIKNAIRLYDDIEVWYSEFLKTNKAKECIAAFDSALPDYSWIPDIKKADAILWSIR